MSKRGAQDDGGPKVPGYIVTFSDMVTLLLTFFVMLLSLAQNRDPELFNAGRDSFIQSIRGYGLGMLTGKDKSTDFQHFQNKHEIEDPEETDSKRTIDASNERTRRIFKEMQKQMVTMPSDTKGDRYDFPATDVRFAKGDIGLNETAKISLRDFCDELQFDPDCSRLKLYVLGLSGDGKNKKERWTLSARRAKVVADYLAESFSRQKRPAVYSWGAGPGNLWTAEDSPITKKTQILISVLR